MESKHKMIKYGADDVEAIRQEFNIDTEEKREEAFRIIEEWLLKQDHLVKKTFSRDHIERCIITAKGSIERTKLQIDKMCTIRTLLPQYFQISDITNSELMVTFNKCHIGYASKLTKERYRVLLIRVKPKIEVKSVDFEHLNKLFTIVGEFLKSYDYNRGVIFIGDSLHANTADILSKFNLVEFQQFVPVVTEGLGCKIKGIIFLTPSKLIESFVRMIKPFFKEKIRNRIHVATSIECLKDYVPDYVLPVEYGGTEEPLEKLHDDLFATLSEEPIQELLREMNAARTDETKRRRDKFNDQYLGMPGTFRTMSLD